ncbi:MAG TPA: phosphatase PAP2 family protein [Thermoanaerobaculia bacterium]|nr:phosphatase PAP2 family protein [Thermoanaerobaculia bacterium]
MSLSALTRNVRIEDVLSVFVAVVLLTYIVSVGAWGSFHAGGDTWTVSFIALPMSIIIFLASLRYALGAEATTIGRWVTEVTSIARDWLPFMLFLLFYGTFYSALWAKVHPRTFDATLLSADRALFGETPSVAMQSWISGGLTSFMSLCYFLHLVFPPVMAFLWYRRDVRIFRQFLLAILFCGAIGTIGYLLIPAVGPGVAYPQLYSKTLSGSLYQPIIDFMDRARAPRDAFPSLHVGISAIVLIFAARYKNRIVLWILAPLIIGNWISTVYLRYHYVVDCVAGMIAAVLSVLLAIAALRWEARYQRAASLL